LNSIQEDEDCEFFIHSQIREDAFDLYGFQNYENLLLFKKFIAINGIGPKVALEILNLPIDQILSAIANDDSDFICKIPGIGQKTAKRIVLELKGKIELADISGDYKNSISNIDQDAFDALTKLGYKRNHINKTLKSLPENIVEAEEIITYFLKNA
jgi:holliday junction DNA helicase RuvA